MTEKLFETALSITPPWHVAGVDLDVPSCTLTIRIDFTPGSQFTVAGVERPSSARHGDEALPASELLPA